jgi:diguanylate cyclase (GGDEF)-like protein
MKEPDIPINEKKRLTMLKSLNILDTVAEERFDRITRMAKRMFNVPIAMVSLVDENRQWFKSCIGVGVTEAPRETSFCGHAILDDKVLLINSTKDDVRFFDNPLVTGELNIQFYAGCPLVVNGYKLGTLCIADNHKRAFNSEDIASLKDLAVTVELELSAMQIATHDELTGLLNRRGFMSLAQNTLNLSIRNQFPLSLVYLDLDEFKSINDNYGHGIGDSVLETFASLLLSQFRESDLVARLGADEFILLLNNTSKDEAEKVVEDFKLSVGNHLFDKGITTDITFSSGIVGFDHLKHESIDALLTDGDKLMYESKKSKRNMPS